MKPRNLERSKGKNPKRAYIYGILVNTKEHTPEFTAALKALISDVCEDPAEELPVYRALTDMESLQRVEHMYGISVTTIWRRINEVYREWDAYFGDWKFRE